MLPSIYRKGQGYLTRVPAAVALSLLLLLGVVQLYRFMIGFDWGNDPLAGFVIPIVEQPFNVGFIAAAIVAVGGGSGLFWFLNRKKTVDLLIETETELKKVTWPGGPETINASIVVVVAVVLIGFYLAIVDFVLGRLFGIIL